MKILSSYVVLSFIDWALIAHMITYFSILAVFLACLGLFGLASYTAKQRTKEIGIRKVLGASTYGIVWLFKG